MKNLLVHLFLFLPFLGFGQSMTITPNGLQNYVIKRPVSGKGFEHTDGNISMGTFLTNDAGWLQTNTNHLLFIGNNSFYGVLLREDGTITNFYPIKLGLDAPNIDEMGFTGLTNTLEGAQYVVTTNLPQSKILSAHLVVDLGAAGYVPHNYKFSAGYLVELRIEDNFIYVNNVAGKSFNILNKPFKLKVTFKK